jgi:hypothetical protein
VFAAWFAVGRDGDAQAKRPAVSSAGPATTGATRPSMSLTTKAAKQLQTDLVSRNAADYRSAWAWSSPPSKAPAGTTLSIDTETFTFQQDVGKVNATVKLPGESPQTWRLLLQLKNGHWLVYTMEKVK